MSKAPTSAQWAELRRLIEYTRIARNQYHRGCTMRADQPKWLIYLSKQTIEADTRLGKFIDKLEAQ